MSNSVMNDLLSMRMNIYLVINRLIPGFTGIVHLIIIEKKRGKLRKINAFFKAGKPDLKRPF